MTKTPKNESMLSFLSTIIKKSVELPEDVSILATSVKSLAEELQYLSRAVAMLTVAVQKHNTAISELYAMQDFILKQIKPVSTDAKLPSLTRTKSEKPN
jgi:PleD family two-component response regulator